MPFDEDRNVLSKEKAQIIRQAAWKLGKERLGIPTRPTPRTPAHDVWEKENGGKLFRRSGTTFPPMYAAVLMEYAETISVRDAGGAEVISCRNNRVRIYKVTRDSVRTQLTFNCWNSSVVHATKQLFNRCGVLWDDSLLPEENLRLAVYPVLQKIRSAEGRMPNPPATELPLMRRYQPRRYYKEMGGLGYPPWEWKELWHTAPRLSHWAAFCVGYANLKNPSEFYEMLEGGASLYDGWKELPLRPDRYFAEALLDLLFVVPEAARVQFLVGILLEGLLYEALGCIWSARNKEWMLYLKDGFANTNIHEPKELVAILRRFVPAITF